MWPGTGGCTTFRFLEPIAVGHFKGMDVILDKERTDILEEFCKEVNTNKRYRDFPIVEYIAQYQRRIGCLGAGNFYVMLIQTGIFNHVPFAEQKNVQCGSSTC